MEHRRKIKLTVAEMRLLAEALDSHAYWQVSTRSERGDGDVRYPSPGTHEFCEGSRGEQRRWRALHACDALKNRLHDNLNFSDLEPEEEG